MRISDWGSDVCSSDLMIMGAERATAGSIRINGRDIGAQGAKPELAMRRFMQAVLQDPYTSLSPRMRIGRIIDEPVRIHKLIRSEERRVGKECVSPFRSRGSPEH